MNKIHIFAPMLSKSYKILPLLALMSVFAACKSSSNVLRNGTPEEKFEYAKGIFAKEEYSKTAKIMEPIYTRFRQTDKAEEADWMVSYSYYKMEMYEMASFLLNNFAREYPSSPNAEDAVYFSAVSSYKISPAYNLDPEHTQKAITVLQRYIDTYPGGKYLAEADKMIRELNDKLQKKAYEVAYNYYRLEDYQACIVAFNNVLDETPSTVYREKIMYYRLKAAYTYAKKSIVDKQMGRYTDAMTYCKAFEKFFPESQYKEEVAKIVSDITEDTEKLSQAIKTLGKGDTNLNDKEVKKEVKKESKQKANSKK
ncbi:MAG: outer membrane protein assembly factor BamD [Flavobacteriales bacterium]|nr:outer membrane protein assembly factor BamD [Flavobacteriales bacterium]